MKTFKFFILTLFITIITIFIAFDGFFILKKTNINIQNNQGPFNGIGIFVINLEKSKARYNYIIPQLQQLNLPITRINAIDGNQLSDDDINHKVDIKACHKFLGYPPIKGAIGCSLSHIEFWQSFLKSNYEFAVLFEDDVSFNPKELKEVIQTLTKHADLWDVCSFEQSYKSSPLSIKEFTNLNKNLSIYISRTMHTGAYMINRKAAHKFIEKAYPIKIPVDHYFNRAWEFDIKFTGIEPQIVFQTFGDSEIRTGARNYKEKESSILTYISKRIYKFKTSIMVFLYNSKLYIYHKLGRY